MQTKTSNIRHKTKLCFKDSYTAFQHLCKNSQFISLCATLISEPFWIIAILYPEPNVISICIYTNTHVSSHAVVVDLELSSNLFPNGAASIAQNKQGPIVQKSLSKYPPCADVVGVYESVTVAICGQRVISAAVAPKLVLVASFGYLVDRDG